MPDTYTGFISTGKLQVNGNVYIAVDQSGNLPDTSNNITSSLRAVEVNAVNVTATTINTDNLHYTSLDLSGNLTVAGNLVVDGTASIGSISFNNIDLSGNLNVNGNTTLNSAYIQELEVGNLIVDSSQFVFDSLEITQNLTVGGTTSLNILDVSGTINSHDIVNSATLSSNSIVTPAGFAVDASSNVTVSGTIETTSGFVVDAEGNVSVAADTTVHALLAEGEVSLNNNVFIGENLSVTGGEYLGGNLYANGGVTVGDGLLGQGVTMESSGSILKIFSQDASGNVYPATVDVEYLHTTSANIETLDAEALVAGTIETHAGFSVDASSNVTVTGNASVAGTISTTSGFAVDSSGNVLVSTGGTTVQALLVNGNIAVNQNAYLAKNVAIMGGEYLNGNLYANGGVTVGDTMMGTGVTMESSGSVLSVFVKDSSMNLLPATIGVENLIVSNEIVQNLNVTSLVAETIETPGGFAVDSSGNVTTDGTISTTSGFSVDPSGNVSVAASTTVHALLAEGQVSLQHNVNVGENTAVQGGLYIEGGVYANNGVVVGDTTDGYGVSIDSSGSALNIHQTNGTPFNDPMTIELIGNVNVKYQTPVLLDQITDGVSEPYQIAVDFSGNLLVTNYGNDTVTVYDGKTGTLLQTISENMYGPIGIAIDPSGYLYVGNYNSSTVTKYELVDSSYNYVGVFTSNLGGPTGIAFSPLDDYLYVTNYIDNFITSYDQSGSLIQFYFDAAGDGANSICFDNSGNFYVANSNSDNVVMFDPSGGILNVYTSYISQPYGLAIDASRNIYVPDVNNNRVSVIDPSGELIAQINGFGYPETVFVNNGYLYIGDTLPTDCLYVFNLEEVLYPNGFGNITCYTMNTQGGFAVDTSANVSAHSVNINHSYTLDTLTDVSGNTYISIDSSNNSVGAPSGAGLPSQGLYVYINGTRYIINLFPAP